jgi:hypothetical protein
MEVCRLSVCPFVEKKQTEVIRLQMDYTDQYFSVKLLSRKIHQGTVGDETGYTLTPC